MLNAPTATPTAVSPPSSRSVTNNGVAVTSMPAPVK